MRSLFRKSSAFVGSFLPQSLGKLAYLQIAQVAQKKAQKKWGKQARVWARNSVLTKAFRPLDCELDLSLYVPEQVSEGECREFRRELRKLKIYFPWLGDLAVYDQTSRDYLESANFFILARDPFLKEPLLIPEREPAKAEALVFLLKTLESEWGQLVSEPLMRLPQWKEHWANVSDYFEGFKDFEMKEVFNRILHFASISPEEKKSVVQYLNNTLLGRDFDMDLSPALWQFFPGRFVHRYQEAPEFQGLEAQTMAQAIAWEVWSMWACRGDLDKEYAQKYLTELLKVAETSFGSTENSLCEKTQKQIQVLLSALA